MDISYKEEKTLITIVGNLITGTLFITIVCSVVVFVGSLSYGIYKLIEIF